MTHDPRLEQVLAAILTGAPNPLDDDREPDYEAQAQMRRDPEADMDRMENRYERERGF